MYYSPWPVGYHTAGKLDRPKTPYVTIGPSKNSRFPKGHQHAHLKINPPEVDDPPEFLGDPPEF